MKAYEGLIWYPGAPPEMDNGHWSNKLYPGMVIEIKEKTGNTVVMLVGDINDNMGLCNCCQEHNEDQIVRWAWLPGFDYPDSVMMKTTKQN